MAAIIPIDIPIIGQNEYIMYANKQRKYMMIDDEGCGIYEHDYAKVWLENGDLYEGEIMWIAIDIMEIKTITQKHCIPTSMIIHILKCKNC